MPEVAPLLFALIKTYVGYVPLPLLIVKLPPEGLIEAEEGLSKYAIQPKP